jgi:hypothetical protein
MVMGMDLVSFELLVMVMAVWLWIWNILTVIAVYSRTIHGCEMEKE